MVDGLRGPRRRALPHSICAFVAAGAAFLGLVAGCSPGSGPTFRSAERLTPEDFRAPEATVAPERPLPAYAPERPRAERVQIRTLRESEAREGVGQVEVEPGVPDAPEPVAEPGGGSLESASPEGAGPEGAAPSTPEILPEQLELVDAMIGDLNGRPLRAREWLEPMGARLRANSRGRSRGEWRAFAADAIGSELITQLQNELLLAEARSALTPEEKAGLRVFMERFERDVIAANYGSPTLADERLRETYGTSLEQAKREREKAILIEEQLRKKVWNRVQVSSRDLQLEYERNLDVYQPPPEAVFLLIRVRSDPETVGSIASRLAEEPFAEVAQDERNQEREPQVRRVPEGLEKADLFGIPELQAAAAGLSPGEWAGPIETGAFTRWVYLDRIEDNSRSLYDVQLELRDRITAERRAEEATRFLLRILNRAGISDEDLTSLTRELVDVAEQWYYRPEGA